MLCLLASYLFCTATVQGYPSSVNNAPCLYVLIHGDNLFETLVLSTFSIKEAGNLPYGLPAWARQKARHTEGILCERDPAGGG